MIKILDWLLKLLYPPKCVFCMKLLKDEETEICGRCRRELPEVTAPVKRGQFFDCCHSVYYYENDVADAVKRFKFHGRSYYAPCFGSLIAMRLLRENAEFDLITWAPVSAKRRRKRGYDQGELLAGRVSKELGVPYVRTLKKLRDNPPQSTRKDTSARQANVLNAYREVQPEEFYGKRLLVIDDVITSGSTLSECCRVLKTAGADSLVCATLAATRK